MKAKVAIIILIIVSAVLGFSLISRHKKAVVEKQADESKIQVLSNDLVQTRVKLNEQETVNVTLETNLVRRQDDVQKFSNDLVQTAATLAKAQVEIKTAQEKMAAQQVEITKKDAQIADLQGQGDELEKQIGGLKVNITSLEKQIGDTEIKLAASEGDRAFLLKELKRLQAEKAQLEKQFNDLAVLRDQVKKLKEELSISRRLEWIRLGILGQQKKGAERLMMSSQPKAPNTNYNLNVEIEQGGGVRINSTRTNAPAGNTNPPVVAPGTAPVPAPAK